MQPMMGVAAPPKPPRGGTTSLIAGILSLVVAGLAIGGSFGPITKNRSEFAFDGPDSEPTVYAGTRTWWEYNDAGSTDPSESASYLAGLALVFAAALLVLGAGYAFAASRSRTSGLITASRSLIVAGASVTAGAVLLVLFDVLDQMSSYNDRELSEGESIEFTAGLGLYLPLGGVVVGIVAVVLAHVGQRPRVARVEPNTPRMGFAQPYGGMPPGYPQPGQAPAATPHAAAAATPVTGTAVPVSERQTEAELPQPPATPAESNPDDPDGSADTQVVSNATATQTEIPVIPVIPATPATPAGGSPDAVAAALAGEPGPSAAPEGAEEPKQDPTPLSDLPAAPPAPELSSSDEEKKPD